ncbi:MAG: hypothetical protein J0M18_17595 [Ignavibacteria bacterium]|jgi:hypothetical protein|nr:hypothetical protein [Ignavibacteria bacterium]
MIPQFKNLSEEETTALLDAPALIAVLIAGADNKIDEKEIDYSSKIAHYRAGNNESILQGYYAEVDKFIGDAISQQINSLPKELVDRQHIITEELAKLNGILPKLDKGFAAELYKSFLSFAKSVAQSSGGLWGYASITPEEERLLGLSMINNPAGI